jgi:hypothetical protein
MKQTLSAHRNLPPAAAEAKGLLALMTFAPDAAQADAHAAALCH